MYIIETFLSPCISFFFFFNDTATTEIYTLSLHDALPISSVFDVIQFFDQSFDPGGVGFAPQVWNFGDGTTGTGFRSEEHTSELQSQSNLVCRLLLEKKKKQ